MLRLAQKYGDAVLDEKLVDYLPPGLAHAGWNNVTFGNLLDMVTGIGDEGRERDDTVYADENRPKMVRWVRLKSAREKTRVRSTTALTRGGRARCCVTTARRRSCSRPRWTPT